IDGVGIGFDFFEFIYRQWPESRQKELAAKFTSLHFIPDLRNHSHARNLTRRLIEHGFSDEQIEKILRDNWLRIFKEWKSVEEEKRGSRFNATTDVKAHDLQTSKQLA